VYATAAATLVAATYVKVGIRYTNDPAGNLIHFYVNGVEVAQDTTSALGIAPNATNVPASVPFHVVFGAKTNASAALTMGIDKWRLVGEINDGTYG
jgi:hypothetical protein